MSFSSNSPPLPDCKGPKLCEFPASIEGIKFLRTLSSETNHGDGDVPHSRVFLVALGDQRYALKVFNFFSLEELRPFIPGGDHLLENRDKMIQDQLDPFYAECRAFGRLVQKEKDDELAVRCYGYKLLPAAVERQINKQFKIKDWNRGKGHERQPLRAIVKAYIRFRTPFARRKFPLMREKIKELNALGIYNMDIREDNYLGGRLFDFSIAITAPHLSLWTKLRFEDQILADINYDLECFDYMVGEKEKENAKMVKHPRSRYNLRPRSAREPHG
ncbi:hypothetical protein PFICI_03096 [Pestalotiopsis fici W106-1]|uniref:Protein kinase domain-containing protein n=1 Tax=Pestalotiopsis fici (strain W106-1 / CGMCC3.15140) TaxID=1229662 RepID=W3XIJ7_PESFW|nr:uncharacterized protein PFICI_03096 [Pestalotiopsis fici W106-1]ETS85071.1 hypothetical protein PFICI_03096 [Pestalotiopsis fici W106-1]